MHLSLFFLYSTSFILEMVHMYLNLLIKKEYIVEYAKKDSRETEKKLFTLSFFA